MSNRLLLETGDVLLQETGDDVLLNNEPDTLTGAVILPVGFLRYDDPSQNVTVFVCNSSSVGVENLSSPTIELSKNGGAWAVVSDGTWTGLGYGYYLVTLDEDDCDTLGPLFIRVTVGGYTTVRVMEVGLDAADVHSQYLRVRSFFKESK